MAPKRPRRRSRSAAPELTSTRTATLATTPSPSRRMPTRSTPSTTAATTTNTTTVTKSTVTKASSTSPPKRKGKKEVDTPSPAPLATTVSVSTRRANKNLAVSDNTTVSSDAITTPGPKETPASAKRSAQKVSWSDSENTSRTRSVRARAQTTGKIKRTANKLSATSSSSEAEELPSIQPPEPLSLASLPPLPATRSLRSRAVPQPQSPPKQQQELVSIPLTVKTPEIPPRPPTATSATSTIKKKTAVAPKSRSKSPVAPVVELKTPKTTRVASAVSAKKQVPEEPVIAEPTPKRGKRTAVAAVVASASTPTVAVTTPRRNLRRGKGVEEPSESESVTEPDAHYTSATEDASPSKSTTTARGRTRTRTKAFPPSTTVPAITITRSTRKGRRDLTTPPPLSSSATSVSPSPTRRSPRRQYHSPKRIITESDIEFESAAEAEDIESPKLNTNTRSRSRSKSKSKSPIRASTPPLLLDVIEEEQEEVEKEEDESNKPVFSESDPDTLAPSPKRRKPNHQRKASSSSVSPSRRSTRSMARMEVDTEEEVELEKSLRRNRFSSPKRAVSRTPSPDKSVRMGEVVVKEEEEEEKMDIDIEPTRMELRTPSPIRSPEKSRSKSRSVSPSHIDNRLVTPVKDELEEDDETRTPSGRKSVMASIRKRVNGWWSGRRGGGGKSIRSDDESGSDLDIGEKKDEEMKVVGDKQQSAEEEDGKKDVVEDSVEAVEITTNKVVVSTAEEEDEDGVEAKGASETEVDELDDEDVVAEEEKEVVEEQKPEPVFESPKRTRTRTPSPLKSRSPSKSPVKQPTRSPSPVKQVTRSPSSAKQPSRSPSPVKQQQPSRSPSPAKPPSPAKQPITRSPSPAKPPQQRSPSPKPRTERLLSNASEIAATENFFKFIDERALKSEEEEDVDVDEGEVDELVEQNEEVLEVGDSGDDDEQEVEQEEVEDEEEQQEIADSETLGSTDDEEEDEEEEEENGDYDSSMYDDDEEEEEEAAFIDDDDIAEVIELSSDSGERETGAYEDTDDYENKSDMDDEDMGEESDGSIGSSMLGLIKEFVDFHKEKDKAQLRTSKKEAEVIVLDSDEEEEEAKPEPAFRAPQPVSPTFLAPVFLPNPRFSFTAPAPVTPSRPTSSLSRPVSAASSYQQRQLGLTQSASSTSVSSLELLRRRSRQYGGIINKSTSTTSLHQPTITRPSTKKSSSKLGLMTRFDTAKKVRAFKSLLEDVVPSYVDIRRQGFHGTEGDYRGLIDYMRRVIESNEKEVESYKEENLQKQKQKQQQRDVGRPVSVLSHVSVPEKTVFDNVVLPESVKLDIEQKVALKDLERRKEVDRKNKEEDLWFRSLRERVEKAMSRQPATEVITEIAHPAYDKLVARETHIDKEIAALKLVGKKDKSVLHFPDLTSEMKQKVSWALNSGEMMTLVEKFNIEIRGKDIRTLSPGCWLNDEVINFYLNLVMERSTAANSKHPKIHVYNTFFYSQLRDKGYASVKRWSRRHKIYEKDLIIIPIHMNVHWTCAVINLLEKRIEYYDSLHGSDRGCCDRLLEYLKVDYPDKTGNAFNADEWTFYKPKSIPVQQNGYDCGVFTCLFAEYRSRLEEFDFDQSRMPYLRQRLVWEITNARLLVE